MPSFQREQHNYGIDILRVFAMFSICFGHLLCNGGISDLYAINSLPRLYLCFFSCFLNVPCCLNCFALVSGYMSLRSSNNKTEIKVEHLVRLEFQSLFFTILIAICFALFHIKITKIQWFQTFFPVLSIHYWYLSAYMPILLLNPIIIAGIQGTSRNVLRSILWGLFIVICALSQLPVFGNYSSWLAKDFSAHWLMFCFVLGCYAAKYGFGDILPKPLRDFVPKKHCIGIIVFILCSLMNWSFEYAFPFLGNKLLSLNIPSIWRLGVYKSPFNVFAAMGLLHYFHNVRLSIISPLLKSILIWASSGSFGVYLFHCNNLILSHFLMKTHIFVININYILLPIVILIITLMYYILGATIDSLRRFIYYNLRKSLSK